MTCSRLDLNPGPLQRGNFTLKKKDSQLMEEAKRESDRNGGKARLKGWHSLDGRSYLLRLETV